nr:MAG: E1 protein [Arctocephalus gazella papillomavirus 2]
MDPSGTGRGEEFLLREAECSDGSSDEGDPIDPGEDEVDFIDNRATCSDREEHLALFVQQTAEAEEEQLQQLKRKYSSPGSNVKVHSLSPRLAAISITPPRSAKRRLFREPEDSGYGNTLEAGPATQMVESTQVENGNGGEAEGPQHESGSAETPVNRAALPLQLLKSRNTAAAKCGVFKGAFGVSFTDLSRAFRSDKTTNAEWVCACFGVHDSVVESALELLKPHCSYAQISSENSGWGIIILLLLAFTTSKNRTTVENLLSNVLAVRKEAMMAEPPKVRSTAAAMYWYKATMTGVAKYWGEKPQWILQAVSLRHVTGEATQFDLSAMIQWAYDNEYTDESTIAYEYAALAETDANAAAFLSSNSQAKYVKDCCTMAKHYLRAERNNMTMSQWIRKRQDIAGEGGNHKVILQFLKYQNVEVVPFLTKFKQFLKGIPKKNCISIQGPPNTGKSAFCMSLIQFLGGRVVSYVNHKSHFWLQPMLDAKVGLLDDVTDHCWDYIDVYLRNALDGNPVCLDSKHRAPTQVKFPPFLITTNVPIMETDRYKYLHSRVQEVKFPNPFPLTEDGECVYNFSPQNWKAFFEQRWAKLESTDEDDDEGYEGEARQPFRCTARAANDHA